MPWPVKDLPILYIIKHGFAGSRYNFLYRAIRYIYTKPDYISYKSIARKTTFNKSYEVQPAIYQGAVGVYRALAKLDAKCRGCVTAFAIRT